METVTNTHVPILFNVPFRRDPDFVPHELLDTLQTCLTEPASRAALYGLGGVGFVFPRLKQFGSHC